MGGTFCGVPVVVTDEIVAASDTIILVDAAGIAAASGPIEIAASGNVSLHMDSVPTNPPVAATVLRSMFGTTKRRSKFGKYRR